jgi:hypothetical protein
MRKFILPLIGAAAFTFETAASAQVTIDAYNTDVAVVDDQGITFAVGLLELGGASPFDHFVTFTEALDGTYGFTLTTTASTQSPGGAIVPATDLDFSAAWVSDAFGGTWNLLPDMDNTDVNEDWGLASLFLPAGTYTLHIQGTRGLNTQYSGGIAFAAIPEPASWAMMLFGFGAVGFAMRRRRRPVLAQIA